MKPNSTYFSYFSTVRIPLHRILSIILPFRRGAMLRSENNESNWDLIIESTKLSNFFGVLSRPGLREKGKTLGTWSIVLGWVNFTFTAGRAVATVEFTQQFTYIYLQLWNIVIVMTVATGHSNVAPAYTFCTSLSGIWWIDAPSFIIIIKYKRDFRATEWIKHDIVVLFSS